MGVVTTLVEAADALADVVTAIDSGIRMYDTPLEAHPPSPEVTGEITCRNLVQRGAVGRNAPWDFDAVLLLATRANVPGWPEGVRRIRLYASPFGAKSIIQAVYDDETLGVAGLVCRPLLGSLTGEQRVKFPDGDRWVCELTFRIRIGA